jgi:cell wall-associated NlpC family hydrolase
MYETYKHLLDLPYIEGEQDCYGLARRYFQDVYDLEMRNYARPLDFAWEGIDLIQDNFQTEGFCPVDVALNNLQVGDGVLMRLAGCPKINHVGVYVGNNLILHHVYGKLSCTDNFSMNWKRRVAGIVRHPDVEEINRNRAPEKLNFLDLLPPHVLHKTTP